MNDLSAHMGHARYSITKNRRSKLTSQQRWEVTQRRDEGEDPKDLALEFGITASYVRQL